MIEKELLEKIFTYHTKVVAGDLSIQNKVEEALVKAKNLKSEEAIARCLGSLAWIDYLKGDLESAIKKYEKALKLAEKNGLHKVTAALYNNQALAYSRLGDRPTAISKFFKALKIFKDLEVKSQEVNVLENVACQYTDLGELEKAEEYFLEAISLNNLLEHKGAKGLNVNMSMMYLKKGEHQKALDLLNDSLNDKNTSDSIRSFSLSVMAQVYFAQDKNTDGLKCVDKSIAIANKNKMKAQALRQNCVRVNALTKMGQYKEAKEMGLELLTETTENANLINLYISLYSIYEQERDFENALKYYKLHEECMKKVDGVKSKNHLASIEGKFQNILKE